MAEHAELSFRGNVLGFNTKNTKLFDLEICILYPQIMSMLVLRYSLISSLTPHSFIIFPYIPQIASQSWFANMFANVNFRKNEHVTWRSRHGAKVKITSNFLIKSSSIWKGVDFHQILFMFDVWKLKCLRLYQKSTIVLKMKLFKLCKAASKLWYKMLNP